MSETKALTVSSLALTLTDLTAYERFAEFAIAAGIVPRGMSPKEMIAQSIVKMQYGKELRIPPMQALRSIDIVSGQPCERAHSIAGRLKASGKYDYRVTIHTNEVCEIEYFEKRAGGPPVSIGVSCYAVEEAKRAGLFEKKGSSWRNHTADMLYNRAMTRGARMYCPDIAGGSVYDPEELDGHADAEVIDAETGEVLPSASGAATYETTLGDLRMRGSSPTRTPRAYLTGRNRLGRPYPMVRQKTVCERPTFHAMRRKSKRH